MLGINSIKQAFIERNESFSFPPDRNREQILIDFRKSVEGRLPPEMMADWNELMLSNNYDDKWIVFQIISVLDTLPIDSLEKLLNNLLGAHFTLAEHLLKELQRIFHWHIVESALHRIFSNSKSSATRLAVAELMANNHPVGFGIAKGSFYTNHGLPNYYWHENRFLMKHPGLKDDALLEKTKNALHERHALLLQSILSKKASKFYCQWMANVLPRKEERCFEDLQTKYSEVQLFLKSL